MPVNLQDASESTSVPRSSTGRLMYYINCIDGLIGLSKEVPEVKPFTEYKKDPKLSLGSKKALLVLVILLNPDDLEGKCILEKEDMCGDRNNLFININDIQPGLIKKDDVIYQGIRVRTKTVMVYRKIWMIKNYVEPATNLIEEIDEEMKRLDEAERKKQEEIARKEELKLRIKKEEEERVENERIKRIMEINKQKYWMEQTRRQQEDNLRRDYFFKQQQQIEYQNCVRQQTENELKRQALMSSIAELEAKQQRSNDEAERRRIIEEIRRQRFTLEHLNDPPTPPLEEDTKSCCSIF